MGAQAADFRSPAVGLLLLGLGSDLHRHLHRPPVHKVLAFLCPVCHLVVPGLGQAAPGRPDHPVRQTLDHLEVHEGLLPRQRIRSNLMTLPLWFRAPFIRDYIMSVGLVTSEKESAGHILSKKDGGNLLAIIIGGSQEALDARPGAYRLLLKNRKGFIRLALIYGAALVPIFSFGENNLFNQVENTSGSLLRRVQNRLQKIMGISLPLFHGRGVFQYSFGFMPFRQPINTVVGKPIQVPKTLQPSEREVNQLHQRYINELCKLFEEHKLKFNVPADQHLEFC
ncbi:2-acylglycerol O-acyltransferase 2 isoform X2 [Microtus oregoni]|uniref:2-acylglycerol O-acyltransferase 2 isoform X2 n=1 Tax=Microtus oregoni TaxID=111838 RepID=UPI001BB1963F|nr:2-acylglycerol O-acyltransferase 2 isoform X2 [Microtus oregoni]